MTGNNQPLVSVIMPYYNGREFFKEALQSILDQTYPNIEIVVVDDASPNKEHSEYLKELSVEFGFKLIKHQTNKGIGQTLADAAEASCGDFIAELSQDDFYKPKKIEKQMNELVGKGLDAVYVPGDILYQQTGKFEIRETASIKEIVESGAAAEMLRMQNLPSISIQGLLARRQIFEKEIIPIWRDYLLDDWPVNIRLFERYKVGFIDEPLWTGRGHATNTSRNIWKWFGPQVEVVARMAPEKVRTEAVGGRLISMARRINKQNGSKEDSVHLALAGLMLVDSPQEEKRAKGLLEKMPYRIKKAAINQKLELLKNNAGTVPHIPDAAAIEKTGWDDIGKNIAKISIANEGQERLDKIGKVFLSLSNSIAQHDHLQEMAAKTAMTALALLNNEKDQMLAIDVFRGIKAQESIIKKKCQALKEAGRFSLRSLMLR